MIRWTFIGACSAMRQCRSLVAALALALVAMAASAGSDGQVAHSFSPEGLAKVSDYVRNEIATGKIPGAILLLQQHGKPVYYQNFGVRDVATEFSMSADTIFRLYSMSKPITTVRRDDAGRGRQARTQRSGLKFILAFADEGRRREAMRTARSRWIWYRFKRLITPRI